MSYGYEDGLLSNSMLQAAIVCPVKYQKLYVEKVEVDRSDWFDATFVGTIVHDCIEIHDDNLPLLRARAWELISDAWNTAPWNAIALHEAHEKAVARTQEYGAQYGTVYKAPEMTSFFKREYGGLLQEWEKYDKAIMEGRKFAKGTTASGMVRQIFSALTNWTNMRIADAKAVEIVVKEQFRYDITGPNDIVRGGTIDRLERREGGIAICDYKTGRWPYTLEKVANSDQFGLYDKILRAQGQTVVEWVLYDLVANNCIRFEPTDEARDKFNQRDRQNVKYWSEMKDAPAGVPAGMPYKIGCPCILAETGDCPYVVKVKDQ